MKKLLAFYFCLRLAFSRKLAHARTSPAPLRFGYTSYEIMRGREASSCSHTRVSPRVSSCTGFGTSAAWCDRYPRIVACEAPHDSRKPCLLRAAEEVAGGSATLAAAAAAASLFSALKMHEKLYILKASLRGGERGKNRERSEAIPSCVCVCARVRMCDACLTRLEQCFGAVGLLKFLVYKSAFTRAHTRHSLRGRGNSFSKFLSSDI